MDRCYHWASCKKIKHPGTDRRRTSFLVKINTTLQSLVIQHFNSCMHIFSAFVRLYNLFHWKAFLLRKIILCQQTIQWLPRGHRVDDSFGSWTIVLPLGRRPQQTPVSVFSSRCFCSLSRRIDR